MTIAEKDLVFQESVQTQTNIIHFYLKEKSAQFSCVPLCSLSLFFFLNLVISVYFSEFTLFINGPSHDFPCRGF